MAEKSPYSRYYNPLTKPLTGNVAVPGPNDPVGISQQGNTTYMDFGIEEQNAFGNLPAPITQSERGADALLRAMGRIPDMPRDLMRMNLEQRQAIGALPPSKPSRPTESYGINRGGTGKAGRGGQGGLPQFGQSQFDTGPGYEPLEMSYSEISDKPWELDENTNADVSPGTSLTPKPETNLVDKEPDLQSPRGMYEALAKKYPDILTQNLDQLQQGRVTMEDVEGLRDQSGLGSLFIAASKAASGAGSIGGKTAESIAPGIVQREDTLARQRLKDRMDVASENMALNAKAVDLAMKQINFADEREQYDPNSEVSKFARDFMRDEFEVDVPDDVPAYQLKQFLPAIVRKYQAKETGAYRNAMLQSQGTYRQQMLEARTVENMLNDAFKRYDAALKSGDRQAAIQARKDIAEMQALKKGQPKAAKQMPLGVTSEQAKVEMDLAKQFRADKTVLAHELMQNELRQLEGLVAQGSSYSDQALITKFNKILDPGSVVRETEYANTERGGGLIKSIENYASKVAGGGRLQPSQRQEMIDAARALANGVAENYSKKRKEFSQQGSLYGARREAIVGSEPTVPTTSKGGMLPSGKPPLTEAERAKLKRLRELKGVK